MKKEELDKLIKSFYTFVHFNYDLVSKNNVIYMNPFVESKDITKDNLKSLSKLGWNWNENNNCFEIIHPLR